jgi:hypothetical protein
MFLHVIRNNFLNGMLISNYYEKHKLQKISVDNFPTSSKRTRCWWKQAGKNTIYWHPTASGRLIKKNSATSPSLEKKSNALRLACHHTADRYAAKHASSTEINRIN